MKIIIIFLFTLVINSQVLGHKSIVDSYFKKGKDCRQISYWFYFCGNEKQLDRVIDWLNQIRAYDIGNETITGIEDSEKKVLIMHLEWAVNSAGKTLAPAVSALSNGKGVDVVVQMNLDMPENGSHLVTGKTKDLIPFTAVQNFFHELSHARHKTNGTFWMSAGEKQAINDENIFREEEAKRLGEFPQLRDAAGYDYGDMQIWFGVKEENLGRNLTLADYLM